jgi:hypothetical protein
MLLIVVGVFVATGLSSSRSCGKLPIRMAAAAQLRGQHCTVSGSVNHGQDREKNTAQQSQGLGP